MRRGAAGAGLALERGPVHYPRKLQEAVADAGRHKKRGRVFGAAGQGRVIKRVGSPPRKVGQPPGSKSLEAIWQQRVLSVG
jgi:hypothetical protein